MKTVHATSTELVTELDAATVQQSRALLKRGINPHLAVVAVGEAAQSPFVRVKQKRGHELGVEVSVYRLPETVRYADVESVINFVNDDPDTAGAIIQLPLPPKISPAERSKLLTTVKPIKDVDALRAGSVIQKGNTIDHIIEHATAKQRFVPTTAAAMLLLAKQYDIKLSGSVVVVGKGVLVGTPLHLLLTAMEVPHAWVDKETKGYMDAIKSADVILAGTDAPSPFLTKKTVKAGAVILAAGNEIDHVSVDGYAALVSAKTGSIGPLTVSLLLQNTVNTTKWQQST